MSVGLSETNGLGLGSVASGPATVPTWAEAAALERVLQAEPEGERRERMSALLSRYNRAQRATQGRVERFYGEAGLEGFWENLEPEKRARWEPLLASAHNRDEVLAGAANRAWLAAVRPDLAEHARGNDWGLYRDAVAKRLGYAGEGPIAETELYARIRGQVSARKTREQRGQRLAQAMAEAGLSGEHEHWLDAYRGDGTAGSGARAVFDDPNQPQLEWPQEERGHWRMQARAAFEAGRAARERLEPVAQRVLASLAKETSAWGRGSNPIGYADAVREGLFVAREELTEELLGLAEEDRQLVYRVAAQAARDSEFTQFAREEKGAAQKVAEKFGRFVAEMWRNTTSDASRVERLANAQDAIEAHESRGERLWRREDKPNELLTGKQLGANFGVWLAPDGRLAREGLGLREATTEEVAAFKEQIAREEQRFAIEEELRGLAAGEVDPARFESRLLDNMAEAPGQLAYMAQMRLPFGVGYALFYRGNVAMRTKELMGRGVPLNRARDIAQWSSIGEGLVELAEARLVFGKVPGVFKKMLGGPLKTLATRELAKRGATVFAAEYATQNLQEFAQDISTLLMQQGAAQFDTAVPEVRSEDWSEFWSSRVDTAMVLLPMALLGTGLAVGVHDRAWAKAYLEQRETALAAGFVPVVADEIATLAMGGRVEEAQTLVKEAWEDPERRQAGTAVQLQAIDDIAWLLEQANAELLDGGYVRPREGGVFAVHDGAGKLVDVVNEAQEAFALGAEILAHEEQIAQQAQEQRQREEEQADRVAREEEAKEAQRAGAGGILAVTAPEFVGEGRGAVVLTPDAVARRDALAAQEPVVIVSDLPDSMSGKEIRAKAKELYPSGQKFTNQATGRIIEMVSRARGELAYHGANLRTLKIMPQLKELVENAVPLFENTGDGKHWHHYGAAAVIDGEAFFVRLIAHEGRNGKLQLDVFYDAQVSHREIIEGTSSPGRSLITNEDARGRSPSKELLVQWWELVKAQESQGEARGKVVREPAEQNKQREQRYLGSTRGLGRGMSFREKYALVKEEVRKVIAKLEEAGVPRSEWDLEFQFEQIFNKRPHLRAAIELVRLETYYERGELNERDRRVPDFKEAEAKDRVYEQALEEKREEQRRRDELAEVQGQENREEVIWNLLELRSRMAVLTDRDYRLARLTWGELDESKRVEITKRLKERGMLGGLSEFVEAERQWDTRVPDEWRGNDKHESMSFREKYDLVNNIILENLDGLREQHGLRSEWVPLFELKLGNLFRNRPSLRAVIELVRLEAYRELGMLAEGAYVPTFEEQAAKDAQPNWWLRKPKKKAKGGTQRVLGMPATKAQAHTQGTTSMVDAQRAVELQTFFEGEPVASLTGEEFAHGEGGMLRFRIAKHYADNGNSVVEVKGVGPVKLDARSVEQSLKHRSGRAQIAAFAAVPDVLRKGQIIYREPLKGATNGDYIHIAAPVQIRGRDYIVDVMVKADLNGGRMYLHDVLLIDELRQPAMRSGAVAEGLSTEAVEVPTGKRSIYAGARVAEEVLRRIYAVKSDSTSSQSQSNTGSDASRGAAGADLGSPLQLKAANAARTSLAGEAGARDAVGGKPVSSKAVLDALGAVIEAVGRDARALNRTGRFHPARKSQGLFFLDTWVTRMRTANDVPTALHELAHALDDALWGGSDDFSQWKRNTMGLSDGARGELRKLGVDLYGRNEPENGYHSEGFAEFGRLWFSDREQAKAKAAEFAKFWEGELAGRPQLAKAIDVASTLATAYYRQGSKARAGANIARQPTRVESALAAAKGQGTDFRKNWIEAAAAIEELSDTAARLRGDKDGKLPTAIDPMQTLRFRRMQHHAIAEVMALEGMVDFAGNPTGGRPLVDAFTEAGKGKAEDFVIYLWAKRSAALWSDEGGGRNPGMDRADAQHLVAEYERDEPQFIAAAQIVYDWSSGVLDYVAEASPALAEAVARIRKADPGFYIPLLREFDDASRKQAGSAGAAAAKAAARAQLTKRLKGSGRRIKHPVESLIAGTADMLLKANQRRVIDQVLHLARTVRGLGHLVNEVPVDHALIGKEQVTMAQLLSRVERAIGTGGALKGAIEGMGISERLETEAVFNFFAPVYSPKQGEWPVFPVWEGGAVKWFEMDPDVYSALSGMDRQAQSAAMEWLGGKWARAFRLGTTGLNAGFSMITNPTRDLGTLLLNSVANGSRGEVFAAWLGAMRDTVLYSMSGGKIGTDGGAVMRRLGVEMAQPLGQDSRPTERAARRIMNGGKWNPLSVADWVDGLRKFLSLSEMAPRLAEARLMAKRMGIDLAHDKLTVEEATQLGVGTKQVTTDFTQAGVNARWLNQIIPFLNAGIQGKVAHARAFKRNPTQFLITAFGMTAAALWLWSRYRDEEWWQEMTPEERYGYVYIPFFGELIRLPLPFEIGGLFVSGPMALVDAWYQEEPQRASGWLRTFLEDIGQFELVESEAVGGASVPVPQLPVLGRLVGEQVANKSFHYGSPIVPRWQQDLPAEEQHGVYTTRAAVEIGRALGVSPRRIDHAIRSVFGGVGMDVAALAGRGNPRVVKREWELADTPVLGRLFQRGGQAARRPRSVNALYEAYDGALKRNRSRVHSESALQREQRLMLADAVRAVGLLGDVAQATAQRETRQELQSEQVRIAKEVVGLIEAGRVNRATGKRAKALGEAREARALRELGGQKQGTGSRQLRRWMQAGGD